jgi:hypothetical protein
MARMTSAGQPMVSAMDVPARKGIGRPNGVAVGAELVNLPTPAGRESLTGRAGRQDAHSMRAVLVGACRIEGSPRGTRRDRSESSEWRRSYGLPERETAQPGAEKVHAVFRELRDVESSVPSGYPTERETLAHRAEKAKPIADLWDAVLRLPGNALLSLQSGRADSTPAITEGACSCAIHTKTAVFESTSPTEGDAR